MKKLLFLIFFVLNPITLSAHVLKVSDNIGVTIHVDPDDDPIVGIESNIYLEFKDKTNQFSFIDCDCIITISTNGTVLSSGSIGNSSLTSASYKFIFPEKNIYKIDVKGKSKSENSFPEFSVGFEIRVDRDPTTSSRSNLPLALLLGFIAIVFLALIIKLFTSRKDSKLVKSEE